MMWHRIPSATEHINMSSVTELIICHHSGGRWDCVWAYAYTSINDDITCHDCIKHVWMYIEYNERNKINLSWLMREHIHTYICVYIYICVSAYICGFGVWIISDSQHTITWNVYGIAYVNIDVWL